MHPHHQPLHRQIAYPHASHACMYGKKREHLTSMFAAVRSRSEPRRLYTAGQSDHSYAKRPCATVEAGRGADGGFPLTGRPTRSTFFVSSS